MSDPASELAEVGKLMRSAVELMARFPADYIPPQAEPPQTGSAEAVGRLIGSSVDEILSDPQVQRWLRGLIEGWPAELMALFVGSSGVIAQVLAMFGIGVESRLSLLGPMALAMSDLETMQLIEALGQIDREEQKRAQSEESASVEDPTGFKKAAVAEIQRRTIAFRAPFARTLTTLLGQDALLWLTSRSAEGTGKIQPHEFSRTGWYRIWEIETQTAIERELLAVDPEAEYLSKMVVAMSWTLAALASFVEPAVFLGERTTHLTSVREGQYTVSSGTGSHTLVSFDTASLRSAVDILAAGLTDPLLSAADLMWMGAALVRVREVQTRWTEPAPLLRERFDLFLSHRGPDAKRPLAEIVQALPATHGVFLDCMTLPRGIVNRSFVYSSLAHSERVLIVETANYNESKWCRKEKWFAEAMAKAGLASLERVGLAAAESRVATAGPTSRRKRGDPQLEYPLTPRVLRDIEYWAREPNLHSLQETGHSTEPLKPIQEAMDRESHAQDPRWLDELSEAIRETLSRVVAAAPDASPIDLWATALQYSVAAFGATSAARSKDEVRRGIDHLNSGLKSFLAADLHLAPVFQAEAPGYLALLAAASAIQLAGFELDPAMAPAVRATIPAGAMMHDGLLLLDARERGPRRDFHVKLLVTLVEENLGGVGIVQRAEDAIHEKQVQGMPLEILPCVTLHPGIELPFAVPA